MMLNGIMTKMDTADAPNAGIKLSGERSHVDVENLMSRCDILYRLYIVFIY